MNITRKIWNDILNNIGEKVVEMKTVPKINKKPGWFSVRKIDEDIYVNNAIINEPSSKLRNERKLEYKNFEQVYPFFIRRENGEKVSAEVTKITRNQVYYFALISNLRKNEI